MPIREWETTLTCPYNPLHQILPHRMSKHLTKCRKQHPDKQHYVTCDFNSMHRYPPTEIRNHMSNCPDRKAVESVMYSMDNAKALGLEPINPPPSQQTFGPDDENWDNEPFLKAYDPRARCAERKIFMALPGGSSTRNERRKFVEAEKERHNKLEEEAKAEAEAAKKGTIYKSRPSSKSPSRPGMRNLSPFTMHLTQKMKMAKASATPPSTPESGAPRQSRKTSPFRTPASGLSPVRPSRFSPARMPKTPSTNWNSPKSALSKATSSTTAPNTPSTIWNSPKSMLSKAASGNRASSPNTPELGASKNKSFHTPASRLSPSRTSKTPSIGSTPKIPGDSAPSDAINASMISAKSVLSSPESVRSGRSRFGLGRGKGTGSYQRMRRPGEKPVPPPPGANNNNDEKIIGRKLPPPPPSRRGPPSESGSEASGTGRGRGRGMTKMNDIGLRERMIKLKLGQN